jgi:hypothetical protein
MAVREGLSQRVARKNEPIRLWEEQMLLKRILMGFVVGISGLLVASTSFAQSFPCTQSMIAGNWVFAASKPASGVGLQSFACAIAIAPDGTTSTSGRCMVQSSQLSLVTSPSGKLSIDSSCHVTGTISWKQCSPTNCTASTESLTFAVQLWRSLDGSRLSGFASVSITAVSDIYVLPFELTYIPQPPPPP